MMQDAYGFTNDYTGRKVDLSIMQVLPVNGARAYPLSIPRPGGEVVTGIEKAAQHWFVQLLTRRGTVIGDTDYGTDFMTLLLQRSLRNEVDVAQAFAEAAQSIEAYTAVRSLGTEPDDEVITDARLLNGWNVTPDTLTLRVGITTRAGNTRLVVVPVKVAIK